MWWLLLKRFWRPLAGVAVLLLAWAWHTHGLSQARREGYQQAVSEDAKTAAQKQIQNAKKERDDAKRIADAYQYGNDAARELDDLRKSRTGVVCQRTAPRPNGVSANTGLSKPETPGDRPLPAAAGPGSEPFDPTDELYALADSADDTVAACRMLNMAVHGMPSAP